LATPVVHPFTSYRRLHMRHILIILTTFLTFLSAQEQSYFQQHVDYKIDVILNVKTQTYTGSERLIYTNNSPDVLSFIWVHLYPNAYKNESTPFAKQAAAQGRDIFHFSSKEERGYINLNSVKSGGTELKWQYKPDAIDEAKIMLPKALQPGQSITINFKFDAKFPIVFSRMGHTKGRYFAASQWYPKPVVYDRFGWHPDSYLDMGEFYGEFGDFDVSVTLPQNYVIDATGMLQYNPEEEAFMDSIVADTRKLTSIKDEDKRKNYWQEWKKQHRLKTDLTKLKTVRFKAHNVHDFAWFSGEDYMVHRKIQKNGVLTNVLALPKNAWDWRHVTEYVAKTLDFYGMRVGKYQYPKASVVDGSLAAGGGMEYPMITVISASYISFARLLEMVVMHEVGHNWFYGMLGSNERASTFMDEGNNDFTEWKYMEHYYGRNNMTMFDSLLGKWNTLSDLGEWDTHYLLYGLLARQHRDLPLNLPANAYTRSTYSGINYSKSGFMLRALEWTLTEPVFIHAMHVYFDRWNGKHPTVDDFWQAMEDVSGMDLKTFHHEWMETTHSNDFVIDDKKTTASNNGYITKVWLANKGDMAPLPVPVNLVTASGDTLEQRWNGNPASPVAFHHQNPKTHVEVNLDRNLFETSYLNNASFPKVDIRFLDPIPSFTEYKGMYYPLISYEYFKDKTRLGLGLWLGNPITMQNFITANAYYGTGSGAYGYHLGYTNRFPGFIGNFSDISVQANDKDGLRLFHTGLSIMFLNPRNPDYGYGVDINAANVNLYDQVYNEPGIYQKARYTTLTLAFHNNYRSMLSGFNSRLRMEKAFKVDGGQTDYSKLEISALYFRRLSKRIKVKADVYLGSVTGNNIPIQEMIFAGGGVDAKHQHFTPGYRGDVAPLRGFTFLNGMNMLGYSNVNRSFLRNNSGFSSGLEVTLPYIPAIYGRVGLMGTSMDNLTKQSLFSEAGFKIGSGNFIMVLPLYISDPQTGEKNFDFRFFFNLNTNIRF